MSILGQATSALQQLADGQSHAAADADRAA